MLLKYETNRLILKVLGPDYAPDVLRFYENDKELFERYETDRCNNFYTEGHQRTILNLEYGLCLKLQLVRFYAFLKEDPDTIIGTVSLYEISKALSKTEIGYKFASAYHHQGYASEAVEKILDVAFTELQLHRVCAHVHESNLPSIRLLEGLGFEKEGICRHHMYMGGKWVDHLQYSLLAPPIPSVSE
ncbi:MAG: GNAT family N-acetyltransferase [Lachnospiraceae bacterium]|nr:GNAT family N-acetyltransferase [Lachnospiraceae bacterium]